MSPFVTSLCDVVLKNPMAIALPEISDARILTAALRLIADQLVDKIYSPLQFDQIVDHARHLKLVVPPRSEICFQQFPANQKETDLIQAGRLLQSGTADSVLAGATHTTADVIRAAIATVGLEPGVRTISGCFMMIGEHLTAALRSRMLFADCGVVIEPTVTQLRDIAASSLKTWRCLNADTNEAPVIAFLSFSTKGSAAHPSLAKIREAVALFQQAFPNIPCDGEMQFDAAIDFEIGQKKSPGSLVAGKANIFIFPDLNSGNLAYKITQRLAGYQAIGPILQGTGKVFSDLSRGASVEDIYIAALINRVRSLYAY